VRQVAASEGIGVPLASSPNFDQAGTPPQYRALLGTGGRGRGRAIPPAKSYWEIAVGSDGTLRGSRNNNASTIALPRLQ
jgi:hypothetical protein